MCRVLRRTGEGGAYNRDMTLKELDSQLNLLYIPIPSGNQNRPGGKHKKTTITIHNTSNASKGADALAHSRWVNNTGFYKVKGRRNWVSWHYSCDELRIVKHLPTTETGYHAGKPEGNAHSIGIEICMNSDMDFTKAVDRAAKLVAVLIKSLGLTTDAIVPHYHWTKKNCPVKMLDGGKPGAKWAAFIAQVNGYLASVTGTAKLTEQPQPPDIDFDH